MLVPGHSRWVATWKGSISIARNGACAIVRTELGTRPIMPVTAS